MIALQYPCIRFMNISFQHLLNVSSRVEFHINKNNNVNKISNLPFEKFIEFKRII